MLLHDLFPRRRKFPECWLSLRVVSHIAWPVPYELSTYAMNLPLHYKYSKSDAYASFWSFAVTRMYIGFCHRLPIIPPFPASETHDSQFGFMYFYCSFHIITQETLILTLWAQVCSSNPCLSEVSWLNVWFLTVCISHNQRKNKIQLQSKPYFSQSVVYPHHFSWVTSTPK